MKLLALFSFTATVVLAAGASADPFSLSLMGGQTVYPTLNYDGGKVDIDRGFNAGLRLGYSLDSWTPISGFEIQADGFYNQSDLGAQTKARFDSVSYMGNLVYHVPTGWPVGIYGGGGAGGVRTEIGDPLSGRRSTVFGWQALGGLDFVISPEAKLFVEYRRQRAHNANLGFPGGSVGNNSNNASIGIAFGL